MEHRDSAPVSKWLFSGPGFGLIVLMLSIALGFFVNSYDQRLQEDAKYLRGRVTALSALKAEAEQNLSTARGNVEDGRRKRQRQETPAFLQYQVSVWEAISGSPEILTLPPTDYSAIALIYGELTRGNRLYIAWFERYFSVMPTNLAPMSKEQIDAWERYQEVTADSLIEQANLLARNLPLVGNVTNYHLQDTATDLGNVEVRLRQLRLASVAIASAGIGVFTYLLIAALLERMSERKTAQTTEPPSKRTPSDAEKVSEEQAGQ